MNGGEGAARRHADHMLATGQWTYSGAGRQPKPLSAEEEQEPAPLSAMERLRVVTSLLGRVRFEDVEDIQRLLTVLQTLESLASRLLCVQVDTSEKWTCLECGHGGNRAGSVRCIACRREYWAFEEPGSSCPNTMQRLRVVVGLLGHVRFQDAEDVQRLLTVLQTLEPLASRPLRVWVDTSEKWTCPECGHGGNRAGSVRCIACRREYWATEDHA
jgi:rubrerythrin